VSRIFITGSTDGLGRGAATVLMGDGHDVVLRARTRQRAAALSGLGGYLKPSLCMPHLTRTSVA